MLPHLIWSFLEFTFSAASTAATPFCASQAAAQNREPRMPTLFQAELRKLLDNEKTNSIEQVSFHWKKHCIKQGALEANATKPNVSLKVQTC